MKSPIRTSAVIDWVNILSRSRAVPERDRRLKEAEQIVRDAQLLEKTGCFGLVIEKVPAALAERIAKLVSIPVIGIGAGPGVDGQVLVTHDMLGINREFSPRFLRRYAALFEVMSKSFGQYMSDVKSGQFPSRDESY